jgi:hypothetical protein
MRIALTALVVSAASLSAQRPTAQSLAWFNGCWEAKNATRRIIERWEAAGAELKGQSRAITIPANVPREPEILKIFVAGDSIVYGAEPPGQRYAEFRATKVSATEVVFENPKHDFPKKISYRLTTKDSLHARVEGDSGSRPLNYPYERIACPADLPTPGEIARGELAPRYADLEAKELAAGSGSNAWMAEHAAPGFQLLNWITSGRTAPVATADVLARAVESSRTNPASAALRDRTHAITLDRINVQGDTAVMQVTVRRAWKFPDNAGSFGTKGDYHDRSTIERRVDRWVKLGGAWKLRESATVGAELFIDGRLVNRDGVILPRR